ncbi:hypothetical protein Tco_1043630 [Tanacetum coccineum]|uniref:Uncharacterized protein n=1 Tax=Tanacetum coccineum TaxID=301880 RepID=A0ABQ5GNR8_9ASTR
MMVLVHGCGLWPGWYWAAVLKRIERWAWAEVKLGREDGSYRLGWCHGEWWKKYWLVDFELGRLQLGCAFWMVKAAAGLRVYTAGIRPTTAVDGHWLMLLDKGHRLLGRIGCRDWARIESSRSDAAIWA